MAASASPSLATAAPLKGNSLWSDAWRRLKRNRAAMIGAVIVILVVVCCFIEEVTFGLIGVNAEAQNPANAFQPPSGAHLFGTDGLGRDYLARCLKGGQTSILVGLVATIASIVIGVVYGLVSGYYGGKLDEIMMRIVDFLFGIPYMFLVILVMLMFSDSQRGEALPVFLALGMVQWLTMARIVRGQVLSLRHMEFVEAAKSLGASDARILFKHILPNLLSIIIIYATLTVPAVIILESFLSFLGLGLELSWGLLVAKGVEVINPIRSYWWLLVFPSVLLALLLFSLNFVGDGLRDALDPKAKR